jgi:hypothetical protein
MSAMLGDGEDGGRHPLPRPFGWHIPPPFPAGDGAAAAGAGGAAAPAHAWNSTIWRSSDELNALALLAFKSEYRLPDASLPDLIALIEKFGGHVPGVSRSLKALDELLESFQKDPASPGVPWTKERYPLEPVSSAIPPGSALRAWRFDLRANLLSMLMDYRTVTPETLTFSRPPAASAGDRSGLYSLSAFGRTMADRIRAFEWDQHYWEPLVHDARANGYDDVVVAPIGYISNADAAQATKSGSVKLFPLYGKLAELGELNAVSGGNLQRPAAIRRA